MKHIADRSAGPILKRDELETFARPVRAFAVLTEEHPLVPFGAERRKLFVKVRRNPRVGPGDFREWWRDAFGPAFAKLAALEQVRARVRRFGPCP